jgi:hypothetical protein
MKSAVFTSTLKPVNERHFVGMRRGAHCRRGGGRIIGKGHVTDRRPLSRNPRRGATQRNWFSFDFHLTKRTSRPDRAVDLAFVSEVIAVTLQGDGAWGMGSVIMLY